MTIKLIDCTLRDGGYYNDWDFSKELIQAYLRAMEAISVDYVELGFRSFESKGFKGGCYYTTDSFIQQFDIPANINLGVMVNGSELIKHSQGVIGALQHLFVHASQSQVKLVRIACHLHEFDLALPGCTWLKNQGYQVGINLMQIADRSELEIEQVAALASEFPLDVLYFADSMGSMNPKDTAKIIEILKRRWQGAIGIHTHDNMGHALANSTQAVHDGVTWVDGTVTGMGRGPGNVKTEYLTIELDELRKVKTNITPLLGVIKKYFRPMQIHYGWGTNSFYFLAGKYGIHPTYIQEMLNDFRFSEEDIIAVIEYLRNVGGKKFSLATLEAGRHFYSDEPRGSWEPSSILAEKEVVLLGTGPGVKQHQAALEEYIRKNKPIVIALNTQTNVSAELIDLRVACHPVRLLADCNEHVALPQPLVTPASMLPDEVRNALGNKKLLDFGLAIKTETFEFNSTHCVAPSSSVIAYVLALATSGNASRILLAGFDGYPAGDTRNDEMTKLLEVYLENPNAKPLLSVTPTRYAIDKTSIYQMV